MLLCKKTGFWITSNMLIQLIELASDEQYGAVPTAFILQTKQFFVEKQLHDNFFVIKTLFFPVIHVLLPV